MTNTDTEVNIETFKEIGLEFLETEHIGTDTLIQLYDVLAHVDYLDLEHYLELTFIDSIDAVCYVIAHIDIVLSNRVSLILNTTTDLNKFNKYLEVTYANPQ